MDKRTIALPQEKWDRLIAILDTRYKLDPDTKELLLDISNQLAHYPSDRSPSFPLFPTKSHTISIPHPTPVQVDALADIIKNKQILAEGIQAYDKK